MPNDQPTLDVIPAHNNQRLFSDYYLNNMLPAQPEWERLAEAARPALEEVRRLFDTFVPSQVEAQVEQDLVRPILGLLGHTFEVQPALRVPGGTQRPDYVLYRDVASAAAQRGVLLDETTATHGALAVADAKHWDRSLDTADRGRGDTFTARSPSWQIWMYVLHSGVEWGILTNGRRWRLYHRDTAHRLDQYYEVDLEALAREGDARRFLYFFLFFRREAFDEGPLSLAEMLRASAEYAREVGDSLKEQVYDALRHLAQGFLDHRPNGLGRDEESLKAIHDNALIVLYRLIFILYAEARDLLPVGESEMYRETYSLRALKREIAHDLTVGRRLLEDSAFLWCRLTDLWRYINEGMPPLHVATFNGGLFDPERHPFLTRCRVGDAHLQQAIDKLARVNGQFVDYRDLSIRHMGTIYEGLLEYRLVAIEPQGGWSIDLLTDKGERKATGSYYTPDDIVKFIVEQAVGPALREAVAGKADDAAQIEAVLRVNVLDPAMGSGHFLVEATEYIARFLVNQGLHPPGAAPGEEDLGAWKRRVVQSCIYGVDLNPLAVELAKLSLWLITVARGRPLSFLDHHLRPGNSLVGADLAHLQQGLPAARAGNRRSREERLEAQGQVSMRDDPGFRQAMSHAVGSMWLIESRDVERVEDVKDQERLYDTVRRELLERYGRLADLATAQRFGLAVPQDQWAPLVRYATMRNGIAYAAFDETLAEAERMARERGFFHWELEFPEIYFDEYGRPLGEEGGFEAVIGNPPYVRQEQLAEYKPYFEETYPEAYHGVADLFVYFFAQGLRQARRHGRLSYVASNSWLRANYAGALRHHLRTTATVESVVDLGDNHVFADAPDVYPAIHVVRKDPPPAEHTARAAVFTRGEGLADFRERVEGKLFPVSIHDQPDAGWQLAGGAGRALFAKLMAAGRPLGEVAAGGMHYGIKTGLNEAFIIDTPTRDRLVAQDPTSAALLKPMLRGEDLRPWYQEDEGRWMIVLPNGWTRAAFAPGLAEEDAWAHLQERLPSLAAHLAPFADAARRRQDKGEYWWELRPCDYYSEFERTKILWPDLTKLPRFSWDTSGKLINNKGYIMPDADPSLLGLLQSRAMWFVVSQLCLPLGTRAGLVRYQMFTQFTSRLPIPDAPPAEREALGRLAMEITERARARYDLHRRTRHRLLADLGAPGRRLNQRLTAWWELEFASLRAEVRKAFKRDIPVAERDQWEAWLAGRRQEHEQLTTAIVSLEGELNDRVYALFALTPAEIRVIEESTKYRYGEV